MSDEIVALDGATFGDAINSPDKPYLVDFWADWCAPCMALEPIVAQFAREHADKIRVGKLNILAFPEIAERFHVKSIPTIIVFESGNPVKRMFGSKGKRQLAEELREFIK